MRVAQHKPAKPAEGSAAEAPPEEEFDEEQLVLKEKPAAMYIAGFEAKVGTLLVLLLTSVAMRNIHV